MHNGFPFVCAEPGGGNARVGDVEDGHGEGLERGRGSDGEVNYLHSASVKLRSVGRVGVVPVGL